MDSHLDPQLDSQVDSHLGSQHDAANPSVSLFSDPFSGPSFAIPSTSVQFNATPTSSNPLPLSSSAALHHNLFTLASPSPSTRNHFDPDDFLVSPLQQLESAERLVNQSSTPELSRRLFVQSDTPMEDPDAGLSRTLVEDNRMRSPVTPLPFPSTSSRNFLPSAIPPPSNELQFLNPSTLLDLGGELTTPDSNNIIPKPLALPLEESMEGKKQHEKIGERLEPGSQTQLQELQHPAPVTGTSLPSTSLPSGAQLPTTPFTPSTPAKCKCSCRASLCLKLYCLCFAHSAFCSSECACKNCNNTAPTVNVVRDAREAVLQRDPRAFEPKLKQPSSSSAGPGRADIHIKGCNCRKGCTKKYCVCRELQVECGPRCTCSGPNGCRNRKPSTTKPVSKKRSASKRNTSTLKTYTRTKASSGVRKSLKSCEAMEISSTEKPMKIKQENGDDSSSSGASAGATTKTPQENKPFEALPSNDPMNSDSNVQTTLPVKKESEHDENIASLEGDIPNLDMSKAARLNNDQNAAVIQQNPPLQNHNENIVINGRMDAKAAGALKEKSSVVGIEHHSDSCRRASEGSNSASCPEADGAELCRLPRIFRVKMGSGRRLNKFSV